MKRKRVKKSAKKVQSLSHREAKRKNIPIAQHQPFMTEEQQKPVQKTYLRPRSHLSPALREAIQNRDVDMNPQLVWQDKETTNPNKLTADAPPLYIQEKVHPKVIITYLFHQSRQTQAQAESQVDLFADFNDFNDLPNENARTELYQYQANWRAVSSKMKNLKICGLGIGLSNGGRKQRTSDSVDPSGFFGLYVTGNKEKDRKNRKFCYDIGKIASLQVPHRLSDAILRDSDVEENDGGQTKRVNFRHSKIGKGIDMTGLRNATPIFQLSRRPFTFPSKGRKYERK